MSNEHNPSDGRYVLKTIVKPGAVPPDGVNKMAYYDEDYQDVEEWVPYTEAEKKMISQFKAEDDFMLTGNERLTNVESVQDDLVVFMGDIIGGAASTASLSL